MSSERPDSPAPERARSVTRRRFLKRSLTASLAAPLVMSLEETALLAQGAGAKPAIPPGSPALSAPKNRRTT